MFGLHNESYFFWRRIIAPEKRRDKGKVWGHLAPEIGRADLCGERVANLRFDFVEAVRSSRLDIPCLKSRRPDDKSREIKR
jgi:hypothetical protein